MEHTSKSWYSVISYTPQKLTNERLNIGIIVQSPENNSVEYYILPENNKKLISILTNDILREEYKIRRQTFELKLNNSRNEISTVNYFLNDDKLIEYLAADFSPYFIFSKKQPVFSSDIKTTLNKLLEIYVSEKFLQKNIVTTTIKQNVRTKFKDLDLLGKKVRSDILIQPIKEIHDLNYKIDFLYKNSNFHLIQTVPVSEDALNDWFSKVHLFQKELNNKHSLQIIYDKNRIENFQTAEGILSYLEKNSSTELIDLNSRRFKDLCDHISSESVDANTYKVADVI